MFVVLLTVSGAIAIYMFLRAAGKAVKYLVVNSILGLATIGLLNLLGFVSIPLNLFTILVVALGGLWGVILLIIAFFILV